MITPFGLMTHFDNEMRGLRNDMFRMKPFNYFHDDVLTTRSFEDKGNMYVYKFHMSKDMARSLKLSIKNGMMTLRGELKTEKVTNNGKSVSSQSYHKSLTLPKDAKHNNIKANYENGKIIIRLYKNRASK